MTNIINKIKYRGLLMGAILVFLSIIPFSSVLGANVFNSSSVDNPLRIGNNTQNQGTQNWQTSLTGVNAGDLLRFSVYFHNAGDIPATNTNVRLQLSPTGSSTSFTATSTISATNFTNYVTTASIGLTSSQSIQLANTATLYTNYDGSNYQITTVPVSVSGSVVTYNLGTVNQGYSPNDGYIIFSGQVSNNAPAPAGTPSVNAGPNKTITSGQSTTLEGTASHSSGLSMTYQWSCNGGSLSSSTVLQPTFHAPSVSSTQTYSCTLVATDTNSNTASSVVYITVNPTSSPVTGYPSVNAGPNKTITSGQSTTLEGTASHSSGLLMTYQWSCNNGSISSSTSLRPVFYAPSVSSTQTYSCTLVARDSNNNTASSIVYITVNPTYSGGGTGYPSVNAGGNRTVNSGQSVTLEGTAYHPNNLYMTYQWSCNGGSLSSSTVLQPIFYAPSVSSTQTYSCTLVARDSNNNTASSIVYITVNPTYSGGGTGYPSVNAGGNRTVNSGQSVTLEGTAYHPNNLYMTYQWSCNGGSLSYSTQLRPTFYAPLVSYTTTYSCTLTARDTNNNTASSVVYITVNPSGQTGGTQDFTVSTHLAENVTSTSATLKGKIDSDYGRNISVRFAWGTTSSQYTNYSPWQYNKRTGDIVSFNITGLQKGKAYHYRLEASDGSRTIYGKNISFITKTDSVSGFSALASGSNRINLTWNSAPQSCYTMIVRKTGSYPQHGADGTVIYYGTGNSYLDTGVTNNLWYYYKAWAVGCDQGLVSFSNPVQSRAYTVSGQVTPTTPVVPVVTTISSANVEILARNISKDQFSWQNNITASKGDKIEFKIVITPTGNKSLEDVKLITSFSNKITSIENLVVDGSTSYFNLDRETSFGTIKLGESRVITFTGTMDNFNNQIINSIEVSAKGINTIRKDLTINTTSFQQGAAFMNIFGPGAYGWLLLILIILMVLVMMYLILERNRMLLKKEEEEVKVEKSKYFNIK